MIDWNKYNSPYKERINEIPKQLDYVLTTNDPIDKVEIFLYTELAPNIKHQLKIYNVIDPLINTIDLHLTQFKESRIKLAVFYFLEYIFSEYIRDSASILFTPTTYKLASKPAKLLYESEFNSYKKFQKLFKRHYLNNFPNENRSLGFFYESLFCDSNETYKKFITLLTQNKIEKEETNNLLIALGYLKYSNPEINTISNLDLSKFKNYEFIDISLAINKIAYDEDTILSYIKSTTETNLVWGNGYISVCAGCSYLIANLHSNYNNQTKVISNLLNAFEHLKSNYVDDYGIAFPNHYYLLEDISSIIFKDLIGKENIISSTDLNPIQKFLFNELSERYKVHTYSMLYAGLPPKNSNLDELNTIYDIYNCYE